MSHSDETKSMSNSRLTFGRIGLITVLGIFIVAVSLTNTLFRGVRWDLTENRLYTLSHGTIRILESIPEPVNVYFFFSDKATADNPYLRTYAGRVREMLQEFVQYSDDKLHLTLVDPIPFSEDEDRAAEFGLQGISLGTSPETVYMGVAATNSVGDEEIIAFLDPGKETFLEYDLAKLVDTLANPERPVVGLISDLPMTGQFDPQTQRMTESWIITSQIEQIFELRNLTRPISRIDDEIAVLMVVHPKQLSDDTLYAIDQFILRGGKALMFVDPYAEADVPDADPSNPAAAMMASRASNLDRLLNPWGISIADDKVIGDDLFALTVSGPGGRPVRHVGLIGVDESGIDKEDVVTAGLSSINFAYAGWISLEEDAPSTITPLVQSSDIAGPISTSMLGFLRDPNQLRADFAPTGTRHPIAVRVEGVVPSAFATVPEEKSAEHLTESRESINVILIADTDLLTDRLWAQVQNFFGQRMSTAFASNGDFVVNALDNLTGSGDLISVRGRETYTRPFIKVQQLRRIAEDQFRQTEQQLQLELQETENKLRELQASREDRSAIILTSEQEAELERFQQQRLQIRKELRQVQRGLDQQIEDLGTSLKIINIGLVPLLISVLSIILLIIRRRPNRRQAEG
jgi:ABC-type uncharacterized transport system involved in gliding motility auxiliary subunit